MGSLIKNTLKYLFLFSIFLWSGFAFTIKADELENKESKIKTNYSLWNTIDWITQEKGYLHVRNISRSLQHSIATLAKEKIVVVNRLSSSTSILHWLEDSSGDLSPIYREQIENQLNQLSYIEAWTIYNHNKTPLLSKGGRLPLEVLSEKIKIDKSGFSTPLYEGNRLMGYLQIRWNIFLFPELFIGDNENVLQSLLLNFDKNIIGLGNNNPKLKQYIVANQYKGPLVGRENNMRFYSFSVGSNTILFMYPAISLLYYFFRIFLYVFVLLLVFLVFLFVKHYKATREQKEYEHGNWADSTLKKAISLNQETMQLTKEGHEILLQEKQGKSKNLQKTINEMTKANKEHSKKMQESLSQLKNKNSEKDKIEEEKTKKNSTLEQTKEEPKTKGNPTLEQIKEKTKELQLVLTETQNLQKEKQAKLQESFLYKIKENINVSKEKSPQEDFSNSEKTFSYEILKEKLNKKIEPNNFLFEYKDIEKKENSNERISQDRKEEEPLSAILLSEV